MPDCTYCGAYGDQQDHVIPRSRVSSARRGGKGFYCVGTTVSACPECNRILGSQVFPSMKDRAAYIARRLRERYSRLLAVPKWSDEELAEMPIETRNYILKSDRHRDEVLQRIYHAERFDWPEESGSDPSAQRWASERESDDGGSKTFWRREMAKARLRAQRMNGGLSK